MTETDDAIYTEREDGIICVHFKEGLEITPEVQDRLFKIYNEICQGERRPFLFTAEEYVSVTKEGREYATEMVHLFPRSASAVLVKSVAYKIVANFYLRVNKPKSPYKVFSDEEKAIKWLQGFFSKKLTPHQLNSSIPQL